MKENNLIVIKNFKLVNARYKYTPLEIKIILSVIAQINKNDTDFKEYILKVSDIENLIGSEQNNYLKLVIKRLMSKVLEINTENGWTLYNWFSKAEYIKNMGLIKINIHPDLKPYLLNLQERFVKYNLAYALAMDSSYAIRIYELLKEYEKLSYRIVDIEYLHNLLKVPQSLKKRYPDFKRKVLNVAKKEINQKTDLLINLEEIKKGRKVIQIKFTIDNKNNKETVNKDKSKTCENITNKQFKNIDNKEEEQIKIDNEILTLIPEDYKDECIEIIKKFINTLDKGSIISNIMYSNNNKPENYSAYLFNALKNDYGKTLRKERIKQEKLKDLQKENNKLSTVERIKIIKEGLDCYEKNSGCFYIDNSLKCYLCKYSENAK